jgi:hypothetical protein
MTRLLLSHSAARHLATAVDSPDVATINLIAESHSERWPALQLVAAAGSRLATA